MKNYTHTKKLEDTVGKIIHLGKQNKTNRAHGTKYNFYISKTK